jgi:hypothetical protein
MTGIHIDEFYADAAHTLVSLYSVFPRPVTLFAEDICGPDEPDEYGVHSHRFLACFATMVWLEAEGYIRIADTIRQEAIDQAVLSGRCFAALLTTCDTAIDGDDSTKTLPPSIQAQHATIIHHLEAALKRKSSSDIQASFMPLLNIMAK